MRWLALFALVVLTGCSSLQREADDEAARVADHVLPEALDDAISAADPKSSAERRGAAKKWLSDPDPSVMDGQRNVKWEVRGSKGTTIWVNLYTYVESADLLPPDQGEATWGVVCRAYDVARAVKTTTVECPDDTPEEP
ncbi:hypothetical protein [Nocardioides lijunqiniae]|uniref:hypothetical protein n=1 Tax=Nocardioides lijunqiniae TaxID=2760832 RepID=UPI0018781467|nr:hypothetical protein [Nocardioides lijunqiniae]